MSGKLEGGAFGGVDDLYREVILEHFKTPRNKGRLESPNAQADGMNPLCGDQVHVSAVIENGLIREIKFDGHGCAISQSSASMMTNAVKGKSLDDAKTVTRAMKTVLGVKDESGAPAPAIELGDLEALEGVRKYPVRIKCALLSWNTLMETLQSFGKSKELS
jgi:nitrogen fixation NifU-like protein